MSVERKLLDAENGLKNNIKIWMKWTPDREDMHEIIEKYNSGNSELYEIADEYNLWINNLFRLLKENGIIVVETDAKGYDNFYAQHMGAWSKRNGGRISM